MDHDETQLFFSAIYGSAPPGFMAIWTKDDKKTLWVSGENLKDIPNIASNLAESKDVYFGLGLQESSLGKHTRGKVESVCAIGTLWMDIDVSDPSHKKDNLPFSNEEALVFIDELPLKPSIIVNSGHGLHVYWLFKKLWIFENDHDRQMAQTLVREFQKVIIQRAQKRGWSFDNTFDRAILITEDSDFVPAVEFIQERWAKQIIHAYFRGKSDELRNACWKHIFFDDFMSELVTPA